MQKQADKRSIHAYTHLAFTHSAIDQINAEGLVSYEEATQFLAQTLRGD